MAGKPKPMGTIKQLLRLHKKGMSKKAIARSLNMSKNTVKTYVQKLEQSKMDINALMALEDPVLEAKFHPGNPAYKDKRYDHFKSKVDYYLKELKRTGVTQQLLWEEYIADYPQGYSRSQFCFHLSQHLKASKPSMVLQHNPGEMLYIDFAGKKLSYVDHQTGELIYCQVFIACLPYSDYSFAMAVSSQGVEDFIYALQHCLHFLGGVPEVLVPDNLKSAIVKASRYEPDVNRALEDFANHYGMTVIPTRTGKPKDKALVENQVKMKYTRIYARIRNMQFFNLIDLNKAIRDKNRDQNQTRMQQKPYCREERFLSDEKKFLKPLPEQTFELKYYRELKVAKNNHVYLSQDKHYYSVPYAYIGKKVKLIYTRKMVYIYHKGKQIAVHIRNFSMGTYSTEKSHLCSTHKHYLDRSPAYYIARAQKASNDLYQLFELIFKQDKHPEQLYRTCDGLLSLHRKNSKLNPREFNKACQIAIKNKIYSYHFLANIINNKMTDYQDDQQQKPALPEHKNIRGKEYYSQTTLNFNAYDANRNTI